MKPQKQSSSHLEVAVLEILENIYLINCSITEGKLLIFSMKLFQRILSTLILNKLLKRKI